MKDWIQAARLRTLPLSLSGIIMGSGLAYSKDFKSLGIFLLAILTTILYQIVSNLANDLGDAQKGTDENRIGEARMVQSGRISANKMKWGIIITAIASLISSIALISYAFLPECPSCFYLFIGLSLASIFAALLYTLGRKPYGYYALGDLFVFLFFGLLAVLGTEFLYTQTYDPMSLLPAAAVGCFAVAVLNLNNMRDFDNDKKNGKRTFAIILGKKYAKIYELVLLILPFLLGLVYILLEFKDQYAPLLFLVLMIPATPLRRKIIFTTFDKDYDAYLKPVALLSLAFSILFSLGISGIFNF